ncbi:MAG: fused MFS/spermidine synthase [Vicinamibacterales bacterium]
MPVFLYILFFFSGVGGLIYQVIWVRQFGQVFGNTVYSASIVVAIFMLGLGLGSYLFGRWADGRYRSGSRGLLGAYAALEIVIAALGLGISLALPRLGGFVAGLSAYVTDGNGWQVLSTGSYVVRGLVAFALLAPITVLMGGTLTVLVRYVTRPHVREAGWAIAVLYGANTIGAAAGAFLTDFMLVPSLGLRGAQFIAVGLNLLAAAGALGLMRFGVSAAETVTTVPRAEPAPAAPAASILPWTATALACSGFAALGVEILWLRHLGIMLGGFRAVFSLLLTVMLLALGVGALVGGWLDRRVGRPGLLLAVVQAVFAATTLAGLGLASADSIASQANALASSLRGLSPTGLSLVEVWFNLRPMLLEVALPSLVGGCAFPLANAIVQRSEKAVGRRAGVLYAANTVGAVLGSLATGYVLLPRLGMQSSAALLASIAALAIVPLYISRPKGEEQGPVLPFVAAGAVAVGAITLWLLMPSDHLLQRALARHDPQERLLTVSEGPNELLAVVDVAGRGRGLLTNGHAMSSTARLDQRYMRALAHVPLLGLSNPERVLVIGFGVGNTTEAATLYPSVTRVDVADLSRNILDHAPWFADANRNVLHSSKVSVILNDGRMHLQMTDPSSYDLITLEPPPIAHVGVSALYSREFYALARSRLKPGGYLSQWLPAYQVPAEGSLAMVRAFIDIFPNAVLLSGSQAELILIGSTAPRIEFDPERMQSFLDQTPAVSADLQGIELGTPVQVAAMFVGSSDTLARATQTSFPTTDDRPIQEYGVRSMLTTALLGVPASLFELTALPAWCPKCYQNGEIAPLVAGLDLNLALLQQAYVTPVTDIANAVGPSFGARRVLGSAYLGSVLPDSAEVHNVLGVAALREGRAEEAIIEFEAALTRDPRSANARANLGQIRLDQAAPLIEARRYAEALPLLKVATELMPDDPGAHNDFGVALASLGDLRQAIEHFTRAVALAPDFLEAQQNLAAARAATR